MVHSDRDTDSPPQQETERTEITLLYVDPDEAAREAIAAVVAERDVVDVVVASDVSSVRSITDPKSVDCIAGPPAAIADHEALLELKAVPTVLYTTDPPADVDGDLLLQSESLVQKGPADSATLLVEKVLGIVQSKSGVDATTTTVRELLAADLQGVGVFVVDEAGYVEWSNTPFEALFPTDGGPVEQASTADLYARLATLLPDDGEAIGDLLALRGSDGGRTGTHLLVPTESEDRQYLHTSRPLEPGVTGDRVEMFLDVTTVADRYERLTLFDELVDNAEDGLFVLDASGRIEYCNRSYAAMLDYEESELVGQHASTLMADGEIECGHDLLSDLLDSDEGSAVVDIELESRTGETLDAAVHFSVRDAVNGYSGLMGVVRDITERKRRERKLEQYRTLVESAADPMYVLDENGDIQILNRAMAEFVGHDREALVGQNVTELLPAESLEAGRDALRRILSADEVEAVSFEATLSDDDGEARRFEVTVSAITEDGAFEGSVATFRDMTERHSRAEELDLRKQVFARSLRHNIRNETSVIQSYASLLVKQLEGEQAEMAQSILDASQTLAQTSRKVNEFDWLVENDAENVVHDLFPLVKQCVEQVRTTNRDADVSIDIPAGIQVLAIHDIDIGIKNLVENALEHGTEESPPSVDISARVDGDSVVLTVADDGPGIPPSEIDVIEQGEETPLQHASGLGLWLVDHVVEKSGGSVAFCVEDGTSVEVSLRRAGVDQ